MFWLSLQLLSLHAMFNLVILKEAVLGGSYSKMVFESANPMPFRRVN
jgi:hypothetical protein